MMFKRFKKITAVAIDRIATHQRRWSRRNPVYGRLMDRIARYGAYALTGESTFKRVGEPDIKGSSIGRGGGNTSSSAQPTVQPHLAAKEPKRLQVFRGDALGDVLLVTPILRELRRKYPDAWITVTTGHPDLIIGNPNVNEVAASLVPLPGFDVTFNLQYEQAPDDHIVEAYARIAGVSVSDTTPEIYLSRNDLREANTILEEHGTDLNRPICAFHMHSGWPVRDWPLSKFEQVSKALERRGIQVLLLGKKPEPKLPFGIDLRGKTSVRQLAAIIFNCSSLLAVDSSLMHIGVALRVPTVSLFGCTNPEKRLPAWALQAAIYADVICRGCHHRQRPVPAIFAPHCPWESVRCMESIDASLVETRLLGILNQQPDVSIVIPHFNNFEILERCLASIFRYGAGSKFEVIVVDDCSTDSSLRDLSTWKARVRVVASEINRGFAASCNNGAREAKGRIVVLLNNDTTVTPGWLDAMTKTLDEREDIGIVGPKLLYPEGRFIQHCGTVFNENGLGEHIYRYLPASFIPASRPRIYRALTGACMALRRAEFFEVGGFDEAFRMGGEDTDLCFKYLDKGQASFYCPESVVLHHEGYSRGRRDESDPDDLYNRKLLRERWSEFLTPDISNYCLLAEIEAGERRAWLRLEDVPADIVERYDSPTARRVGRYPFKCEIGPGKHPEPGYIHLDVMTEAPSIDIVHDIESRLPFVDNSVGEILANHVMEHVSWRRLVSILADMHRILHVGGKLFIRTPNLRFIMESFMNGVLSKEHPDDEAAVISHYGALTPGLWANIKLFSGQDYPSNFHFLCMEPVDLKRALERAGFASVCFDRFGREFSPGEIQVLAIK